MLMLGENRLYAFCVKVLACYVLWSRRTSYKERLRCLEACFKQ
jgi:hypothetical protein